MAQLGCSKTEPFKRTVGGWATARRWVRLIYLGILSVLGEKSPIHR